MTGGGWTPYDPGQSNPGPASAGPWSAGPPAPIPPSYPPTGGYGPPGAVYSPVGGYGPPGAYPQPNAYAGGPSPTPKPIPTRTPRPTRAPSVTGIGVATVGAALALLGLFLNWYALGSEHAGVKELVQAAKLDGAPGLAHLYFGWALWVVLAIAIAVAIAANLAGSSVVPLAVGGAVAGLVSTVLTYAALNAGRTSGSPFDHAAAGLWLFLLGPLILAAGALFALARPAR